MGNARHRGMLRVILGETLEQKRFFQQALAGRTDLLGRRAEQLGPSHGEVLPSRWIDSRRFIQATTSRRRPAGREPRWRSAATWGIAAAISRTPSSRLADYFQRASGFHRTIETTPVSVTGEQPDFLNAAAVGETTLTAARSCSTR